MQVQNVANFFWEFLGLPLKNELLSPAIFFNGKLLAALLNTCVFSLVFNRLQFNGEWKYRSLTFFWYAFDLSIELMHNHLGYN